MCVCALAIMPCSGALRCCAHLSAGCKAFRTFGHDCRQGPLFVAHKDSAVQHGSHEHQPLAVIARHAMWPSADEQTRLLCAIADGLPGLNGVGDCSASLLAC